MIKYLSGKVLFITSNKTVAVSVVISKNIPIYNKIILKYKKYFAHDDFNLCSKYDKVIMIQVKPYSKIKYWRIIMVI